MPQIPVAAASAVLPYADPSPSGSYAAIVSGLRRAAEAAGGTAALADVVGCEVHTAGRALSGPLPLLPGSQRLCSWLDACGARVVFPDEFQFPEPARKRRRIRHAEYGEIPEDSIAPRECAPVPAPGVRWDVPEVPWSVEARLARIAAGVSLTGLSALVGLDRGCVCNVETGRRIPPSETTVMRWGVATRVANPETFTRLAGVERGECIRWQRKGVLHVFLHSRADMSRRLLDAIGHDAGAPDRAEAFLSSAACGYEACIAMGGAHPERVIEVRGPNPPRRLGAGTTALRNFFCRRPRLASSMRRVLEAGLARELEASVEACIAHVLGDDAPAPAPAPEGGDA